MHHPPPVMQRPEVTAFIGLGANLGDASAAVRGAIHLLATAPCMALVAASGLYRSAPVESSGPDYINAVARITTTLDAPALLDALQAFEHQAGRERPFRNAPRTLDLDLLLYGDACIDSPRLTVPHPRMHERAFVLVPLADIAPERVRPAWLAAVAGQGVERIDP